MAHDPLSPAEALRTRIGTVVATVALLTFVYSVLIVAQFLLGVVVGVLLPVGLYLSYRTFAALDALADAAQRIADAREREVERESGFGAAAEREGSSADRVAERDR
ncbi:hypothetical protein ACFQMF_08205 [Halorubrum rutilum]|uniref:DUF4229 domain-containing protein n=1 Tax=Halorubrum rutilum TaxID=1364933 RepID=A0ABD6AK90_9EURY|nr:hypothetical protein [Halorubrum rutilum]